MAGAAQMGRLAVIATVFRRPALYPAIIDRILAQTRQPDELWWMYEDPADARIVDIPGFRAVRVTIPADVVPPSFAINAALDMTDADYIAYLTDDSLPHPEKYERMMAALDAGAKVVYCAQGYGKCASADEWLERIEQPGNVRHAGAHDDSPFCNVDHTQVAHVRTDLRWPLPRSEMKWSDGVFFRDLVATYGPMTPINDVLDFTCQMPDGVSARL